jgi:hypothetical protein
MIVKGGFFGGKKTNKRWRGKEEGDGGGCEYYLSEGEFAERTLHACT